MSTLDQVKQNVETAKRAVPNCLTEDDLKLIDEEDEILTIFYGEDMKENEKKEIVNFVETNYETIEAEFHDGNQPVYSLIIMIE